MAEVVTLKVEGMDELLRVAKQLDRDVRSKLLRKSVGRGASVVAKRAKELVPVHTGILRKSIRIRTFKPQGFEAEAVAQAGGGKAYYAHMLEFGTHDHAVGAGSNRSSGKQYGRTVKGVKATHFMTYAFYQTEQEQIDAIAKALAIGIFKELHYIGKA